jgi:homoserine trans-succinylase
MKILSSCSQRKLCRNCKNHKYDGIVIPGLPGIQHIFNALQYWMPDQVRHDGRNISDFLTYDTAAYAGMTREQ